jgi:phosphatidylinositol kinase/protein kinase (PI-3  family)
VTTLDFPPGVYRIACEVTMQLLRDNKDSLMSVLDAFIYDPLVEWEDEKRKLVMKKFTSFEYRFSLMNYL